MPCTLTDRLPAALALLATIATGLGVRAITTGAVAKYGGVVLYAVAVYVTVLVVRPAVRPAAAALLALCASWGIELFQLTPIPGRLSAHSTVARLLVGSTFSAVDLAAYPVGVALAAAVHVLAARVHPRR